MLPVGRRWHELTRHAWSETHRRRRQQEPRLIIRPAWRSPPAASSLGCERRATESLASDSPLAVHQLAMGLLPTAIQLALKHLTPDRRGMPMLRLTTLLDAHRITASPWVLPG
jgi:hypothetical protein